MGKENLDAIRAETIGRAFSQEFIGNLSPQEVEELQTSQGGDWTASVTDWCHNLVTDAGGIGAPGFSSTWRIEGGGYANCCHRFGNYPW